MSVYHKINSPSRADVAYKMIPAENKVKRLVFYTGTLVQKAEFNDGIFTDDDTVRREFYPQYSFNKIGETAVLKP